MRTIAAVASCSAVAVLLHGCGGGSPSPSPSPSPAPSPGPSPQGKCINKQIDFATQSVSGSSQGSLSTTLDITGPPKSMQPFMVSDLTSGGNFTLKFDLSTYNVFLNATNQVDVEVGANSIHADVGMKAIFNPTLKQLVLDTDIQIGFPGIKPIKNCTIATIDKMPEVSQIKDTFNHLKEALQHLMLCKSSDGTYDEWETKTLPEPIGKEVKATIDFNMDKDYLWKKVALNYDIDHKGPTVLPPPMPDWTVNSVKANGDLTVTVDKATKVGPSDSDLDYNNFGDHCKKLPHTVAFRDIQQLLVDTQVQSLATVTTHAAAVAAQRSQQSNSVTV